MWNPTQYERFKDERAQPFRDLASLIEHRSRMRVVDLGCGTGELTRELHEQLAAEETIGIDSSETMLLKSQSFGSEVLRFERGDIEAFVADRPFDLIFSNAALHWIPDHERLFARLVALLAPQGQLAIQMPANHDHPSHRIAAEVAQSFGIEPRTVNVLPPEHYAALLHHLGFARQHVRLQVYGHVLPSTADVVEWTKGSTLTPYREALSAERYEEFLAEYTKRIVEALGDERPYFYTFKRVLMWATFFDDQSSIAPRSPGADDSLCCRRGRISLGPVTPTCGNCLVGAASQRLSQKGQDESLVDSSRDTRGGLRFACARPALPTIGQLVLRHLPIRRDGEHSCDRKRHLHL